VNELPFAAQEAFGRIGQVARDLLHPRFVGLVNDACDLDTSALEVEHEQHEMANKPAHREHFDAEEV
jgi:hypothetical protein